jgi:hypothetical protein
MNAQTVVSWRRTVCTTVRGGRPRAARTTTNVEARPARRARARLDSDLTLGKIAADHLYVSFNTVSIHAQRLYRRLGVGARAETVAATRERGPL